jgi:hypothetical protein
MQLQLLATAHPAGAVSTPAQALADVFSAYWPSAAAFLVMAVGLAVAVALFLLALRTGFLLALGEQLEANRKNKYYKARVAKLDYDMSQFVPVIPDGGGRAKFQCMHCYSIGRSGSMCRNCERDG